MDKWMKQLKEIYLNFSFSVLNTWIMLTAKDSINVKRKKIRKDTKRLDTIANLQIYFYISERLGYQTPTGSLV